MRGTYIFGQPLSKLSAIAEVLNKFEDEALAESSDRDYQTSLKDGAEDPVAACEITTSGTAIGPDRDWQRAQNRITAVHVALELAKIAGDRSAQSLEKDATTILRFIEG